MSVYSMSCGGLARTPYPHQPEIAKKLEASIASINKVVANLVVSQDESTSLRKKFKKHNELHQLLTDASEKLKCFQSFALEHDSTFPVKDVAKLVTQVKKYREDSRFYYHSITVADIERVANKLKEYRSLAPTTEHSPYEISLENAHLRRESEARQRIRDLEAEVTHLRAAQTSRTSNVSIAKTTRR